MISERKLDTTIRSLFSLLVPYRHALRDFTMHQGDQASGGSSGFPDAGSHLGSAQAPSCRHGAAMPPAPCPDAIPVASATSHWLGRLPPAPGLAPVASTATLIGWWEACQLCGSPGSWGGFVPGPEQTGGGRFLTAPWGGAGRPRPAGRRLSQRRASAPSAAWWFLLPEKTAKNQQWQSRV